MKSLIKDYRIYSKAFIKNGYTNSRLVKQKLEYAFVDYKGCNHFKKLFEKYFNKELKNYNKKN